MSNSPVKVLGLGSPIVDYAAQVEEAFVSQIPGGKGGMILVNDEEMNGLLDLLPAIPPLTPGGAAANTTQTLQRLGTTTAFLGKLGNDATGTAYRDAYAALGGDASRFKVGEIPNARCLSLITPDSERTLRTNLGAALTFTPKEATPADFAGITHCYIEGYLLFNRDLFFGLAKMARAAGCQIALDLGSYEVVQAARDDLPTIFKDYVDIVFANDDEARAWLGDGHTPQQMAQALARQVPLAAVKCGRDGAWLAQGGELIHAPAQLVENPIDTTGAGDFWAAGFLHAYLKGASLSEAGQAGALLGAAVVQQLGAVLPEAKWGELRKLIG